MNLIRCHIAGFGKLSALQVNFKDGLNVIFAANESGKSTLQRFLIAGLYGQLRSDVKAQRRLDSWVDRYKPWNGAGYGGILWCRLAGGRELEVNRTFGKDEGKIEIRTETGEEITSRYEVLRNGDVVFAEEHLGLAKELFSSVAIIHEDETAVLRGRESLRDRIANLAQAGDERLSVRLSVSRLEESLEFIGSERAPTRPYKQALDRRQALQEEREALGFQRERYREAILERQALAADLERLEQELRTAARATLDARYREAGLKVRMLSELDDEIRNLETEAGGLDAKPDFPIHLEERLNRLEADKMHFAQRLDELRRQIQGAEARWEQSEAERRKLSAYENLGTGIETEKVTEWFVHYLSLSRQKDEFQRTINRLTEESNAFETNLASLCQELSDPEKDWERIARQAAEEEGEASRRAGEVKDRIVEKKAAAEAVSAKWKRMALLAGLCLAGTAVAGGAGLAGIVPGVFSGSLAVVLAVTVMILAIAAVRARSSARQVHVSLSALEAELQGLREQSRASRTVLDRAVASSGLQTTEAFLDAWRRAAQDRERVQSLEPRINEAAEQRARIQAEADEVYSRLKACLEKAGLSAAPGHLRADVDHLRAGMRKSADLRAFQRRMQEELGSLRQEETVVAARSGEADSEMRQILAAGATDSPEGFRQACDRARRFLDLQTRIAARVREFERLRGSLSLEQWRARLEELRAARGGPGENGGSENGSPGGASNLPYQPGVDELELEERRLAGILSGKREEAARLTERIRQAFQNYRTPAEIEEDFEEAERTVRELTLNRRALSAAMDEIRNLARLQQEVWAPQLNRAVEARFLAICPDRYGEVKIDPDFRIQVRELTTSELRPVESLSRGTQDQIYLAVRFGVLELLGNPQEPSPCLLDEPFVAYDHDRTRAAFRVLEEEAKRRQLLLFTCREDVCNMALRHGAHMITL